MFTVQSAVQKDYQVKLYIRIGFLKFRNSRVWFDNLASNDEIERMSITSCNTTFKANKHLMTSFKEFGGD